MTGVPKMITLISQQERDIKAFIGSTILVYTFFKCQKSVEFNYWAILIIVKKCGFLIYEMLA